MFADKKTLKPAIRFKEFTNAWEQHKLQNYLQVSNIKNNIELDKEDVFSISGEFGVVNQIEFLGRSFAGKNLTDYKVVFEGDVVYTKSPLRSNPYGIIKTNKQKTGIVSTLYAVFKPFDNVDSPFIQTYFEQDYRTNKYLHPMVSKGAKNTMTISDSNSLSGYVIFPTKYEQQNISRLFSNLDSLITLHQRKLEKLKTSKICF
ncbi:Uncharacterised protein [Mycoplasmopsis bovigenitalium]|uniref:Uncharacterized protein n=1 Tax=Mycoplasmopsis bovigenitalium TaxID=2112 RepID=A0A449A903_9BACT|nr:restriction endonuclease subunit S [Mycoplasmopsis bovigenitalium]VEU60747.1 Uncharacterised protein [Mycoplasmopsis bovigenitalium]